MENDTVNYERFSKLLLPSLVGKYLLLPRCNVLTAMDWIYAKVIGPVSVKSWQPGSEQRVTHIID